MIKINSLLILAFLVSSNLWSQSLYIKAFGNEKDRPVIFLHGGPGYNSANFEATTAKNLADNGYFVIVYDRRGEGRSADMTAKFTFKETFEDPEDLYKRYDLEKATLIGHSFGGIIKHYLPKRIQKKYIH